MRQRYIDRTVRDIRRRLEPYGIDTTAWEVEVLLDSDGEPETVYLRRGDLEVRVTGIYTSPTGKLLQSNWPELG